jgi:hypothetical protein
MAVLAMTVLAGCVQSPRTPEEFMTMCPKRVAGWHSEFVTELSQLMRVSKDKVPALACKRILTAIQQGRLQSKDFRNVDRDASRLWKVLKGQ